MGRAPCCDKANVKRGPWSPEEDATLKTYLETHGTGGNWIALPRKAGLRRCGKSCRLRWLNYLRPDIKHGGFTEEEDHIICNLYNQMGSRWSVIASQLPGRTDNDVKNYWNTKLKKKLLAGKMSLITTNTSSNPIPTSTSTTTDHLISGLKPSFQPPILVPKLQTLPENSSLSCPNSLTAPLRMISADINYNVPGLSVYDQRLSFNNSVMDFSDHQFDHVNSKKNRDIINGLLSQEVLSISHSSNSIVPASDHHIQHNNLKRASILPEISGCDEYSDGTTTLMDFEFGLSPYDNIVNDVSFEEKAAYNSMSLADHQSIINHH